MTDVSRTIAVKPIIKYPREAQVGKTYLMTIDLQPEEEFEWQYDEEEYPIYCTVDSDLFISKPIGEPVVVLHRFGGSYGEAKFLLTAVSEVKQGNVKIVFINAWGASIKVLELEKIYILPRNLIHLESDFTIEREVIIRNYEITTSDSITDEVFEAKEQKSKKIKVATARALILTALPVEYSAVRAHLMDLREEIHPQGTTYELGRFQGNGQEWEVGIAEMGAGNVGAAIEAKRVINHFKPNILLFVGITGGIKDVEIGDVVVATQVYRYEFKKVENKKVENLVFARPALEQFALVTQPALRPFAYNTLMQTAKLEARKDEWLQRLSTSLTLQPRVFVAPIAVGEKVVASTKSDIFNFISGKYSDAIAVDMEGACLLEAMYAAQRVSMMLIRGISDLIDNKIEIGQTDYQEIASRHASAFVFEILTKLQIYKNSDLSVTSESIATRFKKFTQNIQSSKEDVAEANRHASYIVEQLKGKIAINGQFRIEKVLKAGSYARLTALRKVDDNSSDIDIVAYFTGEGATRRNFGQLKDFICEQLRDLYPGKSQASFANLRGNVRIKSSSGLSIDVVPVIKDDIPGVKNGGWFPCAYGSRYANSWILS